MSIVVEDGTGLSNADSYASVASVDAFFTNLGVSTWTGTTTAKENALKQATLYLDRVYGTRFRGVRKTTTQALLWPRSEVVDDDGQLLSDASLPANLVRATYELALKALTETLLSDTSAGAGGIQIKKTKVGPVEVEKHYIGAATTAKKYEAAYREVLPLLDASEKVWRA